MSCLSCNHPPVHITSVSYVNLGAQVCQMLKQMDVSYASIALDRARCEMMCPPLTPTQKKLNVLAHGPNYIGTSKKMQFGKYARTTPGLETVSNKKYTYSMSTSTTCQSLYPALANKFGDTCCGTYIHYTPKTPMVANKQACFCNVQDPQIYTSYTSKLQPDMFSFNSGMKKMNSH